MQPPKTTNDLLALRAMPELAAALRAGHQKIVDRWTAEVERHVPDADPLTTKQVRDSIPKVLEKIAAALESDRPEATQVLTEIAVAHGVVRFQEHYNIDELIIEYRLLRRIIFDEMHTIAGAKLTFTDGIAIDMGIDTAVQEGVVAFVRHLTDQLQSSAAAESKYLSFLSHDLRNNLNGVTLTLEWLSRRLGEIPEFKEEAQDLVSLRRAVGETVEGMDRLLQAERLRKQMVTLKVTAVDLHRLAADVIGPMTRKAEEKGLQLVNAIPGGAAAHGDRELLSLVLQNLLGNAIKFSTAGVVRLDAVEDEEGVRISVSDQGPGIAPERINQLFEAFQRGETHGQPGMGLGLTIASHATHMLGSDLSVKSELGKGSTFSFVLPPAKPGDAA